MSLASSAARIRPSWSPGSLSSNWSSWSGRRLSGPAGGQQSSWEAAAREIQPSPSTSSSASRLSSTLALVLSNIYHSLSHLLHCLLLGVGQCLEPGHNLAPLLPAKPPPLVFCCQFVNLTQGFKKIINQSINQSNYLFRQFIYLFTERIVSKTPESVPYLALAELVVCATP